MPEHDALDVRPDVQPAPAAAPVPVLPLNYAPPPADGRPGWRRAARITLVLGWAACFIATLLIITHDVESVVITGPILFTLGLTAILAGFFRRDRFALSLGIAHCAVCVLFFALVNLLSWTPNDATFPFSVMGSLYTLATALPTLHALTHDRRSTRPT